jgi:hypothetical protein
MLEAVLFDLTTSTVWELAVEHREVFSVNDTVTTGLGGVSIGESLYQLGDYFARSRPTLRNRILMGLFSPAHAAGMLFGDRPRPSASGYDARGLARDAGHRFALELGAAQWLAGAGGGAAAVGAGSEAPAARTGDLRVGLELVNLPSHGRAAVRRRWLGGGEWTRIDVGYRGGRQDMEALSIETRASLWGRYVQDTRAVDPGAGAAGGLRGHAAFLGTATAFELVVEQIGRGDDFLTAMHLPGPSADVTLYHDRLALRLATDVTPDFAMVRPFALDPALGPEDLAGAKSTLASQRYYYAFGVAAATRVEASYRRARAGAALAFTHHDSIEGLDRHQNAYVSPTGVPHPAITDDADAVDQRLRLRLYGDSALPLTDVRLGASLDYRQRTGSYDTSERTREDLRVSLLASYAL